MTTKSQTTMADITALLRARNPVLWVVTREEARVEAALVEAAAAAGYTSMFWDCAQGVTGLDGKPNSNVGGQDPGDTLGAVRSQAQGNVNNRSVWIMRDLAPWLAGTIGMTTTRQLRNLARQLPGTDRAKAQAIIILTPNAEVPQELIGHVTVIEWPLPDRDEIAAILDATIASLPETLKATAAPNGTRDAAIDAAVGLTGEEAQACYARSLVQLRVIDPMIVSAEKKRIIARERVLEWIDPVAGGLDAVGGLDQLKAWLIQRKLAYSPQARAYGLPAPRGALLVGMSGCGKSLSAKAIATAWGVPLIRLDLGAIKSKFVGDSEGRLRAAFRAIEAIGRCVLWLDEIEKQLGGATQGAADGGVSADQLGALLLWMQERQGEAFLVATANDVSGLPPELLRKGRFDEVWWIDLPTPTERCEILKAALIANGRDSDAVLDNERAVNKIVAATDGFTGAEISELVPDAMFTAFADNGREINVYDLLASAATVVPLSKTAGEKIAEMRQWANGRARRATSPEPVADGAVSIGRAIDL